MRVQAHAHTHTHAHTLYFCQNLCQQRIAKKSCIYCQHFYRITKAPPTAHIPISKRINKMKLSHGSMWKRLKHIQMALSKYRLTIKTIKKPHKVSKISNQAKKKKKKNTQTQKKTTNWFELRCTVAHNSTVQTQLTVDIFMNQFKKLTRACVSVGMNNFNL